MTLLFVILGFFTAHNCASNDIFSFEISGLLEISTYTLETYFSFEENSLKVLFKRVARPQL